MRRRAGLHFAAPQGLRVGEAKRLEGSGDLNATAGISRERRALLTRAAETLKMRKTASAWVSRVEPNSPVQVRAGGNALQTRANPIRRPGRFAADGVYHSLERRPAGPRRVFLLPEESHILESEHPEGRLRVERPSGGARQEVGRLVEIGQGKRCRRGEDRWWS